MGTSIIAGERDLQYFQCQKLRWLRKYLKERRTQTSSEGKRKQKAELADLVFSAMKLPKVSDGGSEKEKSVMADFLTTDKGVLPEPASILNWSRNLFFIPQVTFLDICSYLVGKTNKYSTKNLQSFKSLRGYRLPLNSP